jgi:Na+/H+-dicarboxylate symporter
MLSLIVFSLLFGVALMKLPTERVAYQAGLWQDVYAAMLRITDWVMRFAPLGVFALVAKTVSKTGVSALAPLAGFFFTVVAALAIHAFVNLPLYLWLAARIPPRPHFKALSEALVTAFSTSSSSATLPRTLHCLETKSGVSRRVSSFVVPLGATVNMDGTALYECVAVLFIAQAYGLDLSLAAQVTVVALALLTSVGVAGIPSASLVAIVLILGAVGLPLEGLGLILAVDRILDMCRTAVNVFSDASGAVLVAKWEGETLAYDKPSE